MKRILWAVTLAVCLSAWVEAQTIADLARQERARRQKLQSKIVVTTETLKTQEPATVSEAIAPPASVVVVEPPAAGNPQQPASARDEKWWRGEFQKANDDLKRAQTQLRVLELDLNRANLDLLQTFNIRNNDGSSRAEIAAINVRIDATRKEIETARQKISQLEDDLRRAGGPAGWAR